MTWIWALQAINFYSFYLYRTALGKALKHIDVKGTDRFFAGALAGENAGPSRSILHV